MVERWEVLWKGIALLASSVVSCSVKVLTFVVDSSYYQIPPIIRQVPHEHASLDMFSAGGIERFEACAQHRGPVRLYTVLRDPVQKFFSACYFWRRQVPVGLARKLSRPANLTIHDGNVLTCAIFSIVIVHQ